MKNFKQFILESKLTIYHGDNFNTKKLSPKLMNNGNNQEGIGIYFSTELSTAQNYGKDIVSLEIDTTKFVESRDDVSKHLSKKSLIKLFEEINKIDNEGFYYFVSDWIEVYNPEDIEQWHLEAMADNIGSDQIRNFQITMAEIVGVENFVKIWNKVFKNIHGTYYTWAENEKWFCVINPKLKLIKEDIDDTNILAYKVMNTDGKKAIAGADSRQSFPLKKNSIIKMSGKGIYVGMSKEYVLDYYSGLAENEVLLTFEFDKKDITSGNIMDKEPELSLKKAKLINWEFLE